MAKSVLNEYHPHEKSECGLNGHRFWFTLARSEIQASSVLSGEVSEWLKEHAWKVCIRQRIEGSNPSLSANLLIKTKSYDYSKTLDTVGTCARQHP